MTVVIEMNDKGEFANTSERNHNAREGASASALLRYQASLSKILPNAVNPDNRLDLESEFKFARRRQHRSRRGASIDREEKISLKLVAAVTQILPNGNLVIHGRQETRVNYEIRELQVPGVIHPEDITNQNTIPWEKIAEARLAYGGRGQMTDVQRPRYGQQLIDILFPF